MKVLIVDDVKITRMMVVRELSGKGYPVLEAKNDRQRILIPSGKFSDLVLLDLMTPGMDGFEVCKILKSNRTTKNIPIFSEKSLMMDMEKSLQLGADNYIPNSIDPINLNKTIRHKLMKLNQCI